MPTTVGHVMALATLSVPTITLLDSFKLPFCFFVSFLKRSLITFVKRWSFFSHDHEKLIQFDKIVHSYNRYLARAEQKQNSRTSF